jgi:hypothetical protein
VLQGQIARIEARIAGAPPPPAAHAPSGPPRTIA